ncbi:hypothetical protein APUTEX25_001810, partial [Auxenochlorella protothecoides]
QPPLPPLPCNSQWPPPPTALTCRLPGRAPRRPQPAPACSGAARCRRSMYVYPERRGPEQERRRWRGKRGGAWDQAGRGCGEGGATVTVQRAGHGGGKEGLPQPLFEL